MSPPPQIPIMALLDQPLGHNPDYCFKTQQTIHLKKKVMSLSSGDYIIEDEAGETILKCVGKANLKQQKTLMNANGEVIAIMKTKCASFSGETVATNEAGDEIFRVKMDTKTCKYRMVADLVDAVSEKPIHVELTLEGLKGRATVTVNGDTVGYMYKDHWYDWDHRVEIAANMDYSLVASMVIVLDMMSLIFFHNVI